MQIWGNYSLQLNAKQQELDTTEAQVLEELIRFTTP